MLHHEENMQEQCVKWFCLAHNDIAWKLHHSPNGGYRSQREGARFKAMGTRAGFPDLFLYIPNKNYHGLAIELKTKEGRQSEYQKRWQVMLLSEGYNYVVVRSFDDFRKVIDDYLYNHD